VALLNPPDVVPEAMRFLIRAVLAFADSTCSKDELIALVAPQGLVEAMRAIGTAVDEAAEGADVKTGGSTIAVQSLGALQRLRFVGESSGVITATETTRSAWRRPEDVTARSFARTVRHSLWQVAGQDDGDSVSDLVLASALLAAAPEPLRPFDGFDEPTANRRFDQYQIGHLGPVQADWAVGNLERWRTFRRFAPYLGLAMPVGTKVGARVSARGLIPDSSAALAEDLVDLEPGMYDVATFVDACAKALPFLDGGVFAVVDNRATQELSGGLSLSLRQLEASNLLTLMHESDAGTRLLALGLEPGACTTISHVRWLGSTKQGTSRS
jgi:hypothetical protein